MILYLDIETDSLDATTIWCVVAITSSSPDTPHVFTSISDAPLLAAMIEAADIVVMHNGIMFDATVLRKLWGVTIPRAKMMDTLVLSRLINARLEGGHSLEEWGLRLGFPKGDFHDFTHLSNEMIEYCINDVRLMMKLYELLTTKIKNKGFDKALRCEIESQYIAREMHDNGFKFAIADAKAMHGELLQRLASLDDEIQRAFPPRAKFIRVVTPKLTAHGTISKVGISNWYAGDDYREFAVDCPFSLVRWEPFNPTSPKQIIERLWECGWKPVNKTKGHLQAEKDKDKEKLARFKTYGWRVDEANLSTLPEDAPSAARVLVEYLLTDARRRTLEEWIAAYNPHTGRIHGTFNPLGTRTHRCSHSNPNLGNIANAKTIKYNSPQLRELAIAFGARMRSMWICDPEAWLVGTDMAGAHLRIFAHLIDDKDFTHALVHGDKKNETDPHSLNKRALGDICVDRDRAKTFVFTFLNGGGASKVSEIFACPFSLAKEALDRFIRSYPGLQVLKERVIPADASRGYFKGFDGRLVVNDSEHHMMGMYLQNGEAVIMKHANIKWREKLDKLGIKYKQINFVHDEWVTEVYADKETAELVGKIQSDAIRETGEEFGLRCPLSGESKVGKNWLDVH